MGSKSKQTIGYRYFLGIHMVLAQNKLRVLRLSFGDKVGWSGARVGGEIISVNNRELFGGDKKEGGVSGSIDVLNGDQGQTINPYLQTAIGGIMSAYRGVSSLVFRQVYLGNNPYLKPIAIKVADDEVHSDWEPTTALINVETGLGSAEIYIAMDGSGSMIGTPFLFMKSSVVDYLESLKGTTNTLKLIFFARYVKFSTEIQDCTDADYDTLIAWVNARSLLSGGTSFDLAMSEAEAFFSPLPVSVSFADEAILSTSGSTGLTTDEPPVKSLLFITDGTPTDLQYDVDAALVKVAGLSGVDIYCFNINNPDTTYTSQLDNTANDGVPIISTSDGSFLTVSMQINHLTWADMNPVHILRDAFVSETSGGDGTSDLIGDSFASVASDIYDEGLGVSLFWRNTSTRDEFMDLVKAHADLVTYQDKTTGKYEIKAIRNDFDVGTLKTYDKTNVEKWHDDIGRPLQKELPNQVTVIYTKREDGSEASITATNIAAIQEVGRVIPADKIEYRGFSRDDLAARACMRDLSARTVPLLSGSITIIGFADSDMNIGTPFIVNNPEFGIDAVVVRLTEKEESGGRSPRTILTFLESKFDLSSASIITPDAVVIPDTAPLNSPIRRFEEIGYYPQVIENGVSDTDALLASNPDFGIVGLAGSKPNQFHTTVDTAIDSGGGWILTNSGSFMPVSTLKSSIGDASVVSFEILDGPDMSQISAGSLLLIDSEIMRVDDMVVSGENIILSVGRGCLDTSPEPHIYGASVDFYDGFFLEDSTQYTAGEILDGKLLPLAVDGRLSLSAAVTESVTLDSRAIRPYPVGNLMIDGSIAPTEVMGATGVITWAHRDRVLQLTNSVADFNDLDIGPESGVSYSVEVRGVQFRDDFFSGVDIFDHADFFAADGIGILIRKPVPVGQATEYGFHENGDANIFAPTDFFDASILDIFEAQAVDFFSPVDFFDEVETPTFFGVVGASMKTQIRVVTERDGYENWQTPSVFARNPIAPALLTVENI